MASNPLAGLMQAAPQGPDESDAAGAQVSPEEAGYKQPDQGPFQCANCEYFTGPSSCQKVGGPINPEGICTFFESGGGAAEMGGGPAMGGAPMGGGGGLPPGLK